MQPMNPAATNPLKHTARLLTVTRWRELRGGEEQPNRNCTYLCVRVVFTANLLSCT